MSCRVSTQHGLLSGSILIGYNEDDDDDDDYDDDGDGNGDGDGDGNGDDGDDGDDGDGGDGGGAATRGDTGNDDLYITQPYPK